MSHEPISGVILAGGEGRRMGGQDKGLVPFGDGTLVSAVITRIAPQVDELLISANRHLDSYADFGYSVITDHVSNSGGDRAGPLAGLHAALLAAKHKLLLCVPCDTPRLPPDLAQRLRSGLGSGMLAVAVAEGRWQPTVCLLRRELVDSLGIYLASGGRKFMAWQEQVGAVTVTFSEPGAFANANSPEDIHTLLME